jgi:branched-subunit amino acid ABC-type transport system permease component
MTTFLPYVVIGLTSGSLYGLAGTGLVLTYKTSGIFNFAHGTIAALMAYAFFDLRERQGLPWPLALLVCTFVLAPITGLLLERLARRLTNAPAVIKVVTTVGLLVSLQRLIIIRYGGSIILPKKFLPTRTFDVIGVIVGADQLIIMALALAGMAGLTLFLRSRSGRHTRALVDQPELLAIHGVSPDKVRRRAWIIGTVFAALSGICLAQTVGLSALVLTLLVVQAFGAAAVGFFRSIPLTYLGGLIIGVVAAVSTKYVTQVPALGGFPPSVPFIVLFIVLVMAPSRRLAEFVVERKPPVREPRHYGRSVWFAGGAVAAVGLVALPYEVGTRLPVYTTALAYVLVFLSLALAMRTSGQVSLAQLTLPRSERRRRHASPQRRGSPCHLRLCRAPGAAGLLHLVHVRLALGLTPGSPSELRPG